jgi:AraC family transcriptional regulator of adaptative response/methylated-DNA-[protein]-cysteine methyltransferase
MRRPTFFSADPACHPDAAQSRAGRSETCWHASWRDRTYNGRFWFSVRTTGVYACHPARPASRCVGTAFHASPARLKRPVTLQALQAHRLAGAISAQQAGRPGVRPVRSPTEGDTPPSLADVARHVGLPSGALSKRSPNSASTPATGWSPASAALPQGLARGRIGGRRPVRRGIRPPSRVYETSDKALGMTSQLMRRVAPARTSTTRRSSPGLGVLVAATHKGVAAVFSATTIV